MVVKVRSVPSHCAVGAGGIVGFGVGETPVGVGLLMVGKNVGVPVSLEGEKLGLGDGAGVGNGCGGNVAGGSVGEIGI